MKAKRKYQPNRLFIPNNPLSPRISPELALEIGLNESVVLLQMEFWLATEGQEHAGHIWARKPEREIQRTFPFWGVATVHRILDTLTKKKWLVRDDKLDDGPGRGAGWYRFNMEALATLKSVRVCSNMEQGDCSKMEHGCSNMEQEIDQNGASVLIEEERSNTKNKSMAQALRAARISDTRILMSFLAGKTGPIANTAAQAKAIGWLLDRGYEVGQCKECLVFLLAQDWRNTAVTWWTVTKEIGTWVKNNEANGRTEGSGAPNQRPQLRKGLNEQ